MLDTYLAIVSHPLFFTFIVLCAGVCLLLWATNLSTEKVTSPSAWLQEHYVRAILIAVGGLFVGALCFYLVEIALSVPLLVDRLTSEINKPDTDTQPENLRNLAYAIGTLIAVLAGSATVFFSSLRVWMNERNTRATEQGLLNDKLATAFADLHAMRQITKEGETVWEEDIIRRTAAIDQLEGFALEDPNLIPRLARHLSVYAREITLSQPRGEQPSGDLRKAQLRQWYSKNRTKRNDMEKAVQTLGRFRAVAEPSAISFQIDLAGANLQGCNLGGLDLSGANFTAANLAGASLLGTNLTNSTLIAADLTAANLRSADLTSVKIRAATLVDANLIDSKGLSGPALAFAEEQDATLDEGQTQIAFHFQEADDQLV
ncbi:pentapeptide repeat-containing protein [Phaeobacter piscinae]|uniref:pentapeptide repeat-containing protein n=1 Tax=Phaeobacter piscinae TaxID=1580596 RepID=UPI0013F3A33C|nr:pentapeptide repeat-containing protein [Phaeobacter piscinae]